MDYRLIKGYINSGITHFFVDEISFIPSWLWNMLAHVTQQHGFIFIGAGDWGQLLPVKDDEFDFENSWIVKYMFNHNNYTLTKQQRCNNIYVDTHALRHGNKIDFTKYKSIEHDLALCHTNDAVDIINKKWNDYYAKKTHQTIASHRF